MRPTPSARLTAALGLAVALVGIGLVGSAATARGATHEVDIAEFAFAPAELTITAGDTVTWTNLDAVEHTATSVNGAFDSGYLAMGASYSLTFTTPGTYDYLCTPHPSMTGRIVVVAAPATPQPQPQPSASGGDLPNVAMAVPTVPLVALGVALMLAGLALLWRPLSAARSTRRIRRGG